MNKISPSFLGKVKQNSIFIFLVIPLSNLYQASYSPKQPQNTKLINTFTFLSFSKLGKYALIQIREKCNHPDLLKQKPSQIKILSQHHSNKSYELNHYFHFQMATLISLAHLPLTR